MLKNSNRSRAATVPTVVVRRLKECIHINQEGGKAPHDKDGETFPI